MFYEVVDQRCDCVSAAATALAVHPRGSSARLTATPTLRRFGWSRTPGAGAAGWATPSRFDPGAVCQRQFVDGVTDAASLLRWNASVETAPRESLDVAPFGALRRYSVSRRPWATPDRRVVLTGEFLAVEHHRVATRLATDKGHEEKVPAMGRPHGLFCSADMNPPPATARDPGLRC
jgi:hypothetical protein